MEWKFRKGLCEERGMKNMELVRLRDVGRLLDVGIWCSPDITILT